MNSLRTVTRVTCIALFLTGSCIGMRSLAQQSKTALGSEQEFFDAIKKGEANKVNELLKQQPALIGATYKNGITPILFAVYTDHPEIAESLIATGVQPSIFEAAATGRVERVRELLKQNPELVHAWSADGWTALHLSFAHVEVAKLLIDSGADLNVNSRNKFNATPLQGAAVGNRLELARLYLARGANVNCRSEEGMSPLHEAAANGFLDFARLLIEYRADVNQKDDNGKTPLSTALQYKQAEVAKLLRDHNATQ